MASNWTLTYASCFTSNAAESFGKKYPAEFAQVMANVQTFLDALNDGAKLEQLKREKSFVHNEGKGVVSITQQPLRRNATRTRYDSTSIQTKQVIQYIFFPSVTRNIKKKT